MLKTEQSCATGDGPQTARQLQRLGSVSPARACTGAIGLQLSRATRLGTGHRQRGSSRGLDQSVRPVPVQAP